LSLKTPPLLFRTPLDWAFSVLTDPLSLLSDQAYLEKKAANNALEFLNLWPGPVPPSRWLSSIATVARDETVHLGMVLRQLEKKGGVLARTHKNPYAADLRRLIRQGEGNLELCDRLLVSALIEARSCERFERLQEASGDGELGGFYGSLVASERGHFGLFLGLAKKVLSPKKVESRWEEFLGKEGEIIRSQPLGPRIHSGF